MLNIRKFRIRYEKGIKKGINEGFRIRIERHTSEVVFSISVGKAYVQISFCYLNNFDIRLKHLQGSIFCFFWKSCQLALRTF